MVAIPFGKHAGRPLPEVPTSYLCWLTGECRLSRGIRQAVEAELSRRGVPVPTNPAEAIRQRQVDARRQEPCRRCRSVERRYYWQTCSNGVKQVKAECSGCGGNLGFLPQTTANIALANAGSSPAPLLDLLLALEQAGVESVRDANGVVRYVPQQRMTPTLWGLVRRGGYLLERML
jgi:hypothetical protein